MVTPDTTDKPRTGDRASWAREVLEIPAEAEGAALRGLLLRRLRECDFVPASASREGLATLAENAWDTDDAGFRSWRDDDLREEIEQFACEFFELPPDERRSRYQELKARTGPRLPLAERLAQLEQGLGVGPLRADLAAPARELAELCQAVFVARPVDRAFLTRRELPIRIDNTDYQRGARELRDKQPSVAELTKLLDPLLAAPSRNWKALKRGLTNGWLHIALWVAGVVLISMYVPGGDKVEPQPREAAKPAPVERKLTDDEKASQKLLQDYNIKQFQRLEEMRKRGAP